MTLIGGCISGYYRDSTGSCVQTCPTGYYGNETTRTCEFISCPSNCLVCDGVCIICYSPYLLENGQCTTTCSSSNPIAFDGKCLSSCPQGYQTLVQPSNHTCILCDESCFTCSGPAKDNCLTCNSGSFIQNSTCLSCNSSCETCFLDANYCTSCPNGTYLLGSTCVSECPGTAFESNRTCAASTTDTDTNLGCLSPMSLTSTGNCVYCGGNCAKCSDDLICLVCNPGLVPLNGVCTLPNSLSSVGYKSGAIKSIEALSLLQYSTSETVLTELSADISSVNDITVYWILFAKDIAPDYETLSCDNIQEMVTNNLTQGFPRSVLQTGDFGFEYLNFTDSYGIYLNFTGLRAALNYNYTICTHQFNNQLWDSGSIEFTTKDNGYAIRKIKLTMDTNLALEDLSSFLCALTSALRITNSTIITSEGCSCTSESAESARRLLNDRNQQNPILNSNRRTLASASTNQLDLLVYGDPTSETIDSTTTQIIEKLSSKSFMDSFVYSSSSTTTVSSKGTVKISEVSIGQSIIPEAPKLVTETVSYEVKGNIMFFPNITFSGVDGYAYICLVPNNSQADTIVPLPSSALILSAAKSRSEPADDYLIRRIRFFNGEALAVAIEGVNPNISYNIAIFGTNEDQSSFAFRTPRLLIQAILGGSLPEGSIGFSSFTFIATEIGAVVFLIVTWLGLFSKIKIKICKCRQGFRRHSHMNVQNIQVIRNAKDPSRPQFEIKDASTVIDLQGDETNRHFKSSPSRSVSTSIIGNEKTGGGTERAVPNDNTLSFSHMPLSIGSNLSNRADLSVFEVPEVEIYSPRFRRRKN